MVVSRVKRSFGYEIRVRAIKPKPESDAYVGVVRISARSGISKVAGITAAFASDGAGVHFLDGRFFYGSFRDLQVNYRRPINRQEFVSSIDFTSSAVRGLRGVFIPFDQMNLDEGQRELCSQLMAHIEKRLPAWLQRLHPSKKPGQAFSSKILIMLRTLDPDLDVGEMMKPRQYLEFETSSRRTKIVEVETPMASIILTPSGGFLRGSRSRWGRILSPRHKP